jgi:hypothetical protein
MDLELFKNQPRDYALSLTDEGLIDAEMLAEMLLSYMSHDQVRDALRVNELDPESMDDFMDFDKTQQDFVREFEND